MLQIKQEVVKCTSKADEFYKYSPFYTKGQLRSLCMWGVQLQEFLWTSEYVWKCIVILISIWEGLGQSVLQERETKDIHCIHSDQGCSHIPDPTLRSIHSWGISSSSSSSTCCPYSMLQRIYVFFLCFIITIVVHLYDPKNCSLCWCFLLDKNCCGWEFVWSFLFGFVLEYVLTSFVICALCYHQEFFVSRDVLTCGFAHSKLLSGGFFRYVFLWCWSYVNMIFWHLHSFAVIKSFFVSRKKS